MLISRFTEAEGTTAEEEEIEALKSWSLSGWGSLSSLSYKSLRICHRLSHPDAPMQRIPNPHAIGERPIAAYNSSESTPMRLHFRPSSLLALLFLAAATPLHLYAQAHSSVEAQHATVSLLEPERELWAAESFTAGLDFKMEDGWHVYWINAGDSGEPPAIKWTLPPSVTADAMQFPPPKRLPLGPLMDFGYEDEVVFPIPMHVASMQAFDDMPQTALQPHFFAHVTWLVCREVCIPGKADLALQRLIVPVPRGPRRRHSNIRPHRTLRGATSQTSPRL
jgi:DsbC/DsbD-like thiol-disulfide interchange protein